LLLLLLLLRHEPAAQQTRRSIDTDAMDAHAAADPLGHRRDHFQSPPFVSLIKRGLNNRLLCGGILHCDWLKHDGQQYRTTIAPTIYLNLPQTTAMFL
jgi:hypothetical protein